MFAYAHENINIRFLFGAFFLSFFYEFNLNTQGFVYLEFVKYQLGLYRNVQVFVKCNVSAAVLYTGLSRLSSCIEINCIAYRC